MHLIDAELQRIASSSLVEKDIHHLSASSRETLPLGSVKLAIIPAFTRAFQTVYQAAPSLTSVSFFLPTVARCYSELPLKGSREGLTALCDGLKDRLRWTLRSGVHSNFIG
jgi:hypothetical protein